MGKERKMHRRRFLTLAAGVAAVPLFLRAFSAGKVAIAADSAGGEKIEKITKTDAEWKASLTPAQYEVLRREGTEAPFTSALLHEERTGTFACAGCGLALFPSKFKFDSGTGWPSFFDGIPGHVETKSDYRMIVERTEYHCARCGGHHGHVFTDGPQPTGLRYCNNGVALNFIPDKT
jgi:peptide-methionine (R)-S-oxide reductase